jgi:hypothetical protein
VAPLVTHFIFENIPAGGMPLFPFENEIDFVGHVSMHSPQEKQSGITLSRLRIAPITEVGQAFSHLLHAIQVE